MNSRKRFIQNICYRMKPGEEIAIDRRLFIDTFPCGWPSIYRTPKEAFLSSMIGSGWGVWRVRHNDQGDYIISRHEENTKRYYVDPDREHLFKRMPDGTLELKEKNHVRRS